ncbi:MAG: ABC transporter ATP-binding protein [Thermoprotei archaeon]|nr:MAG: ABC transporter ATP-binding protein [Thermoprotei archaeon]
MRKDVIVLNDIWFRYQGSQTCALRGVNLRIKEGELVAILGRTGSGKSTLLRVISGAIPHFYNGVLKGDVLICGMCTKNVKLSELARYVGFVSEDPEVHIVSFTVEEDVAFGPLNLGLPKDEILKRVKFALEATRLKGFEARNPYTLSGGEKQSLAIAGVLALLPKILVLDEPTSMLDPSGRARVFLVIEELNKKHGITVVMATQATEYVFKKFPRVIIMDQGRILFDGSPRELVKKPSLIKAAGLRIPQVAELAYYLERDGLWKGDIPLTLDEAVRGLVEVLRSIKYSKELPSKFLHGKRSPRRGRREIAVEVENLYYTYPGGIEALKGISLKIGRGEMVAVIGGNGSGKTTLARCIAGLLRPANPTSRIIVHGMDIRRLKMSEIVKLVGYVFQNPERQLHAFTVYEEVAFGLRNLGLSSVEIEKRVSKVLKILGLEPYRDEWPLGLDRGKQLRTALASIIAIRPKVIIVDEPTTGQDWTESQYIMRVLRELNSQGITVLFITHEMELVAKYADRVIVLHSGRILIDGTPREVFQRQEVLAKTGLEPPQITKLSINLARYGIPKGILTVDEMRKCLSEVLRYGVR